MNERSAHILANMIDNLGPTRVRGLKEFFGSLSEALQASQDDLIKVKGIGRDVAGNIVGQRETKDPAEEEKRAGRLGARLVTPVDEEYPDRLKEIYDPPLALYVRGELVKRDRHAIAMVGSRRSTTYGKQTADRLAYQLAKVGYTVVSGLARGIDTAAHRGALKGGGRTLAVIGSALDKLYPPENEGLAEEISGQGAVISEFPLGREPDRTTFPYRNRIVSGLCLGTCVVEAPPKSGALLTADIALEQGRSVFAVPGRVDSPTSRGTNRLIKNGARLVEDVEDIIEEFEFLITDRTDPEASGRPRLQLSEEEKSVVSALLEGPVSVDQMVRHLGVKSARLNVILLGLEMKKVLRMAPGNLVELTVDPELSQQCVGEGYQD